MNDSKPRMNEYGLTWERWAYAAGADPNMGGRETPEMLLQLKRDWINGADPTEVRHMRETATYTG